METKKDERLFDSQSSPAVYATTFDGKGTYDERLNHILTAATDLISCLGYERASMRAVAKATGVSLAGLYHYFDNKEKMLFLIQFRTFGALLSGLREKVHGIDDPLQQLRVMIRAHVGYFAKHLGALKVCSHELDSLSGSAYDETRRIRREYYELTRGMVDRVLDARGVEGGGDRHVHTMALFGMLNWLYRWYDPRQGPSVSVVANQIADQFLHGVLGPGDKAGPAAENR